jgi:hypothetical protein
LKLRNLTLGYNVPSDDASKLGMSRLRVYLQGQNLWFSSNYDTFDPEIGENDLDRGIAPSSTLWTIGVQANF